MADEPFHTGEIAVQERTGERETARRHGRAILPRVVPGALPFLAEQRLLAVSAAGDDGHLWVSAWFGEPGFVRSTDGAHVRIKTSSLAASPDDPVLGRLSAGRDIGMLAIDLTSRRRLRVNGPIEAISSDLIQVRVRESVPNCPKYIQRRVWLDGDAPVPIERSKASGRVIDEERRTLVEQADTAFVGSIHPARGPDASHRGGTPGFVSVVDETTLRVPDYSGNSMFMTLGNFEIDPRASLAIVLFQRGRLVSFSGTARLRFDGDDLALATGGTGRYWDLSVREWIDVELPTSARWRRIDAPPFNPGASNK